ncbi:MAG: hypothetical protein ABI723_09165 [Bacteroidia bacterium]
MKRIISIILISAIMGSTTSYGELLKAPLLVQHFLDHKKSHPSISFIAFLTNHYLKNEKPDSEKDKKSNEQLPFKSIQNIHLNIVQAVFQTNIPQVYSMPSASTLFAFMNAKVLSRSLAIWQPPKVS